MAMVTIDAREIMEADIRHFCPTEPTPFQQRMLAALKGHGMHRLYRTALRRLTPHSRLAAYMYGRSNRTALQRLLSAEVDMPVDRLTGWLDPKAGQSTLRWVIGGMR